MIYAPVLRRPLPLIAPLVSGTTTSLIELQQQSSAQQRERGESSTIMALERALDQIQAWYRMEDAARVRKFISRHSVIAELLIEAYGPLHQHFGVNPSIVLRIESDPERYGCDELFAYIQTPLPPDQAIAALDRFDFDWFLDHAMRADGRFNFNIEAI